MSYKCDKLIIKEIIYDNINNKYKILFLIITF